MILSKYPKRRTTDQLFTLSLIRFIIDYSHDLCLVDIYFRPTIRHTIKHSPNQNPSTRVLQSVLVETKTFKQKKAKNIYAVVYKESYDL